MSSIKGFFSKKSAEKDTKPSKSARLPDKVPIIPSEPQPALLKNPEKPADAYDSILNSTANSSLVNSSLIDSSTMSNGIKRQNVNMAKVNRLHKTFA